jgi:hypothetical protein
MKNKSIITLILFFTISFSAVSQYYDGSAYVYVKDKNGNSRCINVAFGSEGYEHQKDTRNTKSSLKKKLLEKMSNDENMTSEIVYDINRTDNKLNPQGCDYPCQLFSGYASVKINKGGQIREIEAKATCYYNSKGQAKSFLLGRLKDQWGRDDVVIGDVSFNINECD